MDPKTAKPRIARVLRRLLLVAIGGLYVLSIPWYREGGTEPGRWLGLPDWAAVAIVCYVGVAILNAFAWLLTDVDDEAPTGFGSPDEPPTGFGSPDEPPGSGE